MKQRYIAIIIAVLLIILSIVLLIFTSIYREVPTEISHEEISRPYVTIRERNIYVDIARTQEEQQKGLSGRESLGSDEGMLFLFTQKKTAGFWMKDMKFPIDIIWISEMEIVGIEKSVDPQIGVSTEELRTYISPNPVDTVLEINAGKADEWGVRVGDSINFEF